DLVSELTDPNDSIFEFASLYNELDLNQFQIKMLVTLNFFVPLFQSSAIRVQQKTGWIKSDRELYDNELFRIGGTRLLRGFNEESIRSNFYSILTLEYRLLFDRNSNLFIFSDLGYFRQHTANIERSDTPVGLGIGMNLETKIGVFGISYAIGKQEGDPFNFRTGKIHFGMVSLF
ncbi:MAG: BamA/TamA family outer membrane protein, partial [Saprospiraceae bacterium]|nr:BamA/TamA family outer membrane protein [Saprospiraceae bacterium]